MDLIQCVKQYIERIVSDGAAEGMKALLLDSVTTQVVSMVYSQSDVLSGQIYLIQQLKGPAAAAAAAAGGTGGGDVGSAEEKMEAGLGGGVGEDREPMPHLKAVVFVEPTDENIDTLVRELREEPLYAEYHLFFTSIVERSQLRALADADVHEVVRQVQEFYGDYMAINDDFFTLQVKNSLRLTTAAITPQDMLDRHVRGLLSILLAVRARPAQIRYQAASPAARRLAEDVQGFIDADDVFQFPRQERPMMLMILDRRDDPVTPLLTQWTFQAMVHELLGLHNNRVKLSGRGVGPDLSEVVLSCTQDEFFAQHRYDNFGDLGGAVKSLMERYQADAKLNENLTSLEDMQAFMARYPAFRSQSLNVSKHVAIMGEMARLVEEYKLLDVSELEQDIACTADHSAHFRDLQDKINDPSLQPADKLRLALLYTIRYESYPRDIDTIKAGLRAAGLPHGKIAMIDHLLEYAGESRRASGLFGESLMSKLKSITTSLQGVANVYTQHVPLVMQTVEAVFKGRLRDQTFPIARGRGGGSRGGGAATAAGAGRGGGGAGGGATLSGGGGGGGGGGGAGGQAMTVADLVIFMVGGATFEEAAKVAEWNAANRAQGLRVVLGGSWVHNSTSFLQEIQQSV